MEYKILEANGVENENVDGGAFNNFCAGGQSGIVAGVLNECKISVENNTIKVDTGLLVLQGIRIKLLSQVDIVLTGTPAEDTPYQLVAKVVLNSNNSVTFTIESRAIQSLIQDNLYENEQGVYELEIARFIHGTDGTIAISTQLLPISNNISEFIDNTLTVQGKVADAKAVGDELATKLEKMTTDKVNRIVIGQEPNGSQKSFFLQSGVNSNNNWWIPIYQYPTNFSWGDAEPQGGGVLVGNDPTKPYHYATKNYTDKAVKKNANQIKALFAGLGQAGIIKVAEDVENTSVVRQTADGETNGITIVNGSETTVTKIQGKTVKSANLIKVDAMLNANLVKNTDGSYTFTKTAAGNADYSEWFNCNIPVGEYYFTCDIVSKTITGEHLTAVYEMANGEQVYARAESGVVALTPTDTIVKIRLYLTSTIAVGEYITFKNLMLSSENIPYRPYFAGLKSAQISGIKSISNLFKLEGRTLDSYNPPSSELANTNPRPLRENIYMKNLTVDGRYYQHSFAFSSCEIDGDKTIISSGDNGWIGIGFPIKCLPNTQYSISAVYTNIVNATRLYPAVMFYTADGLYISSNESISYVSGQGTTFTTPENCYWVIYFMRLGATNSSVTISDIMFNYGSTALPYREYEESVMQLPENTELGEWDSVDGKTLTKGTEMLTITGDENWIRGNVNNAGTGTIFYCGNLPAHTKLELVSSQYNVSSQVIPWEEYDANTIACINSLIVVTNNPNQTLEEWKAYLNDLYNAGTPLVVALHKATPTTTELEFNNGYLGWDKGQEEMQLENTDAIPKITNSYYIVLGG